MKWQLPQDKDIAARVVEHETRLAELKQEVGLIGWLFGGPKTQLANIGAFAVIMFTMIFGLEMICGTDTTSFSKKDGLTLIGTFISLSLGFVFGQKSK